MEAVIKIEKSYNYQEFSYVLGNRDVNSKRLKEIIKSIEEVDLTPVKPIIVNEKFEIIDGQHRFEACRALGKPIYYFVLPGAGIDIVRLLNLYQTSWGTMDFIKCYAGLGRKDYILFLEDTVRFSVKYSIITHIYRVPDDTIRSGQLHYNEEVRGFVTDFFNEFKPAAVKIKENRGVKTGIVTLYPQGAILAYKLLRNFKDFKRETWLTQVDKYGELLKHKGRYEDYLKMFVDLYNYNRRKDMLDFYEVYATPNFNKRGSKK